MIVAEQSEKGKSPNSLLVFNEKVLDEPWMFRKYIAGGKSAPEFRADILTNKAEPVASALKVLPIELASRIVLDHNAKLNERKLTLEEWETKEIQLRMKGSNPGAVAKSMGLSVRTIQNRLAGYRELEIKRKRDALDSPREE